MRNVRIYLVGSIYTLINAVNLENSFRRKRNSKAYLVYFGPKENLVNDISLNKLDDYFDEIKLQRHPRNTNKFILLFVILKLKIRAKFFSRSKHKNVEIYSQNMIFTIVNPLKYYSARRYYYIEEGLSSYTDKNHIIEMRNNKLKFIDKHIFRKKLFNEFNAVFINNKNLYRGIMKTKNLPSLKTSLIKSICSPSIKKLNPPKKVFFGSKIEDLNVLLNKKLTQSENINFQKSVIEKLNKIFSLLENHNFYYKSHPNELKIEKKNNILKKFDTNFSWEMTQIYESSSVLISIFSTSMVSPKLLYCKEPTIIFLFNMFKPYTFFGAEELFERTRAMYENKNRVIAPNNVRKLAEILNNLGDYS